jgi:microcystin-dependent protein
MATISALGHNGYTLPVGVVISFLGKTAPAGFLVCGGGSVSTSKYPELYRVLGKGTIYGQNTGAGTFQVPNLTNYFISGSATNTNTQTPASVGSLTASVSVVEANMPNFTTNSANVSFSATLANNVITTGTLLTSTPGSPANQTYIVTSGGQQRNPPTITALSATASTSSANTPQTITPTSINPADYIVQYCIRADY